MSEQKRFGVLALALSGILGVLVGAIALFGILSNTDSTEIQQAIASADRAIADRDGEIARLNVELAEARKPEIPLDVAFRGALMGPGYVLVLTNRGTETLQFRATFTNDFRKASETHNLVIDASGAKEFGYSEGWPWVKGDTLRIEAPGFKTREAQLQ